MTVVGCILGFCHINVAHERSQRTESRDDVSALLAHIEKIRRQPTGGCFEHNGDSESSRRLWSDGQDCIVRLGPLLIQILNLSHSLSKSQLKQEIMRARNARVRIRRTTRKTPCTPVSLGGINTYMTRYRTMIERLERLGL